MCHVTSLLERASRWRVFVGRDHYFNAPEPLADWSLVDLQSELAALLRCRSGPRTIAQQARWAKPFWVLSLTYPTFGYLSFNYGFGAGVVVDGKPVFGSFRNAGEISRIYTTEEGVHRLKTGRVVVAASATWCRRGRNQRPS